MISYKLAKQLKEAGWSYHSNGEWINEKGYSQEDGVGVYIPTLSELIEACGKDFWELSQWEKDNWQVMSNINPSKNGGIITIGKSPEEAVAKLWIKLNKK